MHSLSDIKFSLTAVIASVSFETKLVQLRSERLDFKLQYLLAFEHTFV